MKRGDLVTVALPGDFGKPRSALVIQSDRFDATGSVTLLLLTSGLAGSPLFRLRIEPSGENGLRQTSQIMVDKAMSIRRNKVGPRFGRSVNRSLAVFLGMA